MIAEVLTWGLSPETITTDTWYSSQKDLKFFKEKGLGFLTGIAKNRSCSVDGKNFTQVKNIEIPESGKMRESKKNWSSKSIPPKFQKRNYQVLHYVFARKRCTIFNL